MVIRRQLMFLGLSLCVVGLVWYQLLKSYDASISWAAITSASSLSALEVTLFSFFIGFSIVVRTLRYQLLARAMGGEVSFLCAFRAITLGRLFTLITPTALFGGQPISYYCVAVERSPKEAGGVVFAATFLDVCFFALWAPLLILQGTRLLAPGSQGLIALVATGVIYMLVALIIWLALSEHARPLAGFAARLWALVPSWSERALYRTFVGSVEQLNTFVQKLRRVNGYAWAAVLGTLLSFLSIYVAIWWLLAGFGNQDTLSESIGNQLLLNFAVTIVSPGMGSGPTELAYDMVFTQWAPGVVPGPIHIFVFMAASYWVQVIIGLITWACFRSKGTLVTFQLGPDFRESDQAPAEIQIQREGADDVTLTVTENDEYSVLIPFESPFSWSIFDGSGQAIVRSPESEPISCDGYIRRIYLGADEDEAPDLELGD